jgi:hypothetical protein
MSLVPYNLTAIAEDDTVGSGKNIVAGASVNITKASGGSASIFEDSLGATPISLPTVTDSDGQLAFWISAGEYIITIDGKSYNVNITATTSSATVVATFADLANTAASTAGMIVYIKGSVSSGIGGGHFQDIAGSVTNDGGTKINNALTVGRYWNRINFDFLTPQMFGISGENVDNLSKLNNLAAACSSLMVPLVQPYNEFVGVSGNFVLPDNIRIHGLKLKQLTPTAEIRTIFKNSGAGNVKLKNVVVNRNGAANSSDLQTAADAAGVWLQAVPNLEIDGLEVFGDGQGTGARFINLSMPKFNGIYVHDITYWVATAPTTEYAGGVSIENCSQFTFENFVIKNIYSKTGTDPVRRFQTDGLGVGGQSGCTRFTICHGFISNTGEGIDITGSGGNENFRIFDVQTEDTGFAGIKVANGNTYGEVFSNTIIRAGWVGIVVAGVGSALEDAPENIYVHHNQIYDTGANPEISGGSVTYDGIQLASSTGIAGTPRNVFVYDNIISDRQTVKTMNNCIKFYGTMYSGQNIKIGANTYEGFINADVTSDGTRKVGPQMKAKYSCVGLTNASGAGAWVALAPNTLVTDDYALYNAGTYTVLNAGEYDLEARIVWAANATGVRGLRMKVNGSIVASSQVLAMPVTGVLDSPINSVNATGVKLAAGDTVTIETAQTSGGSLGIGNTGSYFSIALKNY